MHATLTRLTERSYLSHENVDEENGVISGVLIVGLKSRNTGRSIGCDRATFGEAIDQEYSYSPEALRNAIAVYEGAVVRVDHPTFARGDKGQRVAVESRSAFDTFGELRKVHFVEGKGLVGDLHYLKSHELSPRIVEAARRFPDKFALSHNAHGTPELVGGKIVITEIHSVDSVDLIGDKPGTTNGLFESQETPKMTKRAVLVILSEQAAKGNKHAKRLTEMDDMQAAYAEEVDVPAEAGGEEQLTMALDAMILAIMHGDGSAEEKLKKIGAVVGAVDATAAPVVEGDEETPSEEEEKAVTESVVKDLIKQVTQQKQLIENLTKTQADKQNRDSARTLLESLNREATEVRIAALLHCDSDADRKALAESWPDKTDSKRPKFSPPISESTDSQYKYDGGKSLAEALR